MSKSHYAPILVSTTILGTVLALRSWIAAAIAALMYIITLKGFARLVFLKGEIAGLEQARRIDEELTEEYKAKYEELTKASDYRLVGGGPMDGQSLHGPPAFFKNMIGMADEPENAEVAVFDSDGKVGRYVLGDEPGVLVWQPYDVEEEYEDVEGEED